MEGRRCVVASRRGHAAMMASRNTGVMGHAYRHRRSSRGSDSTSLRTCKQWQGSVRQYKPQQSKATWTYHPEKP